MTVRCSSRPRRPAQERYPAPSRAWWALNRDIYVATRAALVIDHPFLFRPDRPAALRADVGDQIAVRYHPRFSEYDVGVFLMFWRSRREYIEAVARARWRWGLTPTLPVRNPKSSREWARGVCRQKGWRT